MSETEWISIVDACPDSLIPSKKNEWREGVVKRLQSGRLQACSTKFFSFGFECAHNNICFMTGECQCVFKISERIGIVETAKRMLIPCEFWNVSHVAEQDGWAEKLDINSVVADWLTGDFSSVLSENLIFEPPYIDYAEQPHWPQGYDKHTTWVHWALDVQIDVKVVNRINAQFTEKRDEYKQRATKYDWAGALIYLAAIAEIEALAPNPDAPGSQAKIESVIANWFASNSDQVPSEAAIRPYASRVLEAIKAQGNKAN